MLFSPITMKRIDKVVDGQLVQFSGGTYVDDALSSTSENPVQNKVITAELENVGDDIDDINDEVDAIVNVYGSKNLLDTKFSRSFINMEEENGIYTNTAIDNKAALQMYLTLMFKDGTSQIIQLYPTTTGIYKKNITIPDNVDTITFKHNGKSRDMGINCKWESPAGNYILTVNMLGLDYTTLGGFSFKDLMIRDARIIDETYEPYAKTNQELTEDCRSIEAVVNVYGSKNLLAYPYYDTTKTGNGLTFTDNGDGTIKVGGSSSQTSTAQTTFTMSAWGFILKKGTYIIGGCPAGASSNSYRMTITYKNLNNQNVNVDIYSSEKTFTVERDTTTYITIQIENNVTIPAGGLTFKPMIRDARISDSTWVPYAKTNYELTQDTMVKKSYIHLDANYFANNQYVTCYRYGHIVNISAYGIRASESVPKNTVIATGLPKAAVVEVGPISDGNYIRQSGFAITSSGDLYVGATPANTNLYFSVTYITP